MMTKYKLLERRIRALEIVVSDLQDYIWADAKITATEELLAQDPRLKAYLEEANAAHDKFKKMVNHDEELDKLKQKETESNDRT